MFSSPESWQCVLVLWGDKYSSADVVEITNCIAQHASEPPQFVLLTDRVRDDIPVDIAQRLIPDFYLQSHFLTGGCQAKLAIFHREALPSDLPTIFVDLDTAVLGDLGRLFGSLSAGKRIAMLANNPLSFSGSARLLYRLSGGRIRTRGNSSFLIFHPSACYEIDEVFRDTASFQMAAGNKDFYADDRFISAAFHQEIAAIPTSLAVKFPREFMQKSSWLGYLKTMLPWVKRRRAALVAITFPGSDVDAKTMHTLSEGDQLRDSRGRWLIWSDRYLGDTKAVLENYFDLK